MSIKEQKNFLTILKILSIVIPKLPVVFFFKNVSHRNYLQETSFFFSTEKYFPIISVLFNFILFSNLIGLVPYSFTSTSHLIKILFLDFSITNFLSLNLLTLLSFISFIYYNASHRNYLQETSFFFSNEKYFPIISVLFNFILFSNLIGLVPYSFTSTSHLKEFKFHKYKTRKFKRVAIPISNGDIRYLGISSRKVVQAAILNILGPSFKKIGGDHCDQAFIELINKLLKLLFFFLIFFFLGLHFKKKNF